MAKKKDSIRVRNIFGDEYELQINQSRQQELMKNSNRPEERNIADLANEEDNFDLGRDYTPGKLPYNQKKYKERDLE